MYIAQWGKIDGVMTTIFELLYKKHPIYSSQEHTSGKTKAYED